jgi:hypothetical protein
MRGAVVAQAPVRAGSNNATRTFDGPESKQRKHVALHATKRVKRTELNLPKRSRDSLWAARPSVQAVLFHPVRTP